MLRRMASSSCSDAQAMKLYGRQPARPPARRGGRQAGRPGTSVAERDCILTPLVRKSRTAFTLSIQRRPIRSIARHYQGVVCGKPSVQRVPTSPAVGSDTAGYVQVAKGVLRGDAGTAELQGQ